jgi:phenylalanyl-tRNA synthetase beta chain
MKISLNRLKDYIAFDQTPEEIAALLTGSGLEVEGIHTFDTIKGGLEGIVIGEVLTCEKHPNADKLHITTVDIGEEVVPIVCGASNVAAGQKVIVAKEGAILYPSNGESFQIKKAKIRGEVSQGMICAEDEIGIGNSHAGIIVLNTDLANGTPASAYFQIKTDHVLEIGLTPNRADAASHLGVARDLKALLGKEICIKSTANFAVDTDDFTIKVEVENSEDCPRYAGITLSNIKVGPSPEWLQSYLRAIDLEPINNIVDITNYILHDLGQPLHAFDAHKIRGGKIVVKKLPKDTVFVTLDEKERKLSGEELMICDGEKGLCIAGVFGGKDSGITSQTTHMFLESAYFSPDVIRKGSLFHGLKTDASFRFERGTDPNMPVHALKIAAMMIKELAGGEISSEIVDIYPHPVADFEIAVTYKNIKRLIGKEIPKAQIKSILEGLEIKVSQETEVGFLATVKPYRVDVKREADIIEEILRIYGFDQVELSENLAADYLAEHPVKDGNKLQYRLSEFLTGLGFSEMITNSLTKSTYTEKCGFLSPEKNVEILNKLSEDLGVMRQSLLFTGLEVLAHNINRRQKDLKFFEFGKIYSKAEVGYHEESRLSLFITGDKAAESWLAPSQSVSFPDLHSVIEIILEKLQIEQVETEIIHEDPFVYALKLTKGTSEVGKVGLLKKNITLLAEVKQEVFYADLSVDLLFKKAKGVKKYAEISKFPEVRRDLSLVIDKKVIFSNVKKVAEKAGGRLLKKIGVFDVYEGDKLEAGKKAYALSFYLQDNENTLTDKIIDQTMGRLIESFEKEVGAYIRK